MLSRPSNRILDPDEIHDAVHRLIFLHPIRLSTGKVYELEELIQQLEIYGPICQLTKTKIKWATYDHELKALLDYDYGNDTERKSPYPIDQYLARLDALIHPRSYAGITATAVGLMSALCAYVSISLINKGEPIFSPAEINFMTVAAGLVIGLLDYVYRIQSQNKFGFFYGTVRPMQRVLHLPPAEFEMLEEHPMGML